MTIYEAWPGQARANRGKPVHLVDWPAGRTAGHTLCGTGVSAVALYAVGWARYAGVHRCPVCDRRLAERQQFGRVIPFPGFSSRGDGTP